MKKIIRLTENDLFRIVKRVINEQLNYNEIDKMVKYVSSKWKDTEIEQNSAFIEILNDNGSSIKFDIQKGVIIYDKNFAIDPKPINLKSDFATFKTWFDKNNNYNPISGF